MEPRPFREVTVGKCQVQTATERFGEDVIDLVRERDTDFHHSTSTIIHHDLTNGVPTGQFYTGSPSASSNHGGHGSYEKKVPKMQYYRNNLTSLSQTYNLYFVAYENRLFVYCPRSVPRQTIPEDADLILATGPDRMSEYVGGTMDRRFAHQANAITTGFLGQQEIILMVFDDGTVLAYHTRAIAEYIHHTASGAGIKSAKAAQIPTPFFRENVGSSAWGVAIHQQSRLIAVSSNRREVTVFALGLTKPLGDSKTAAHRHDYPATIVTGRKRNWRIVLLLGEGGHNIPNISFWDDRDGLAEKVCAMDIFGGTWILDIWKPCTMAYRISHTDHSNASMFRAPQGGWGVMVLPMTGAMRAATSRDAFGTPGPTTAEGENRSTPDYTPTWVIDITASLAYVRDSPIDGIELPEDLLNTNLPNQAMAAAQGPGGELIQDDSMSEQDEEDEDEQDDESENDDAQGQLGGTAYSEHLVDGGVPLAPMDTAYSDDASGEDDVEDALDVNTFELNLPWEGPLATMFADANDDADGDDTMDMTQLAQMFIPPAPPLIPGMGMPAPMPTFDSQVVVSMAPGGQHASSEGAFFKNYAVPQIPCSPDSFWLDMLYLPHTGKIYAFQSSFHHKAAFLRRALEVNTNTTPQTTASIKDITSRACLLRTYMTDIELRRVALPHHSVLCRNVTSTQPDHPVFRHTTRLNMILHVPELSLVVIGSAVGQVVLLTPTCGDRGSNFGDQRKGVPGMRLEYPARHGFRIDWVLPTQTDEEAGRRPARPLYGVAIGPIQEGGAEGLLLRRRQGMTPSGLSSRRYRLMLHYRDHSILSYELSRNDNDKLEII
ncbi:hypothetical protein ACHAQA_004085 [Verticillium albo-atrum]